MKNFSIDERKIVDMLSIGTCFSMNDTEYRIINVAKPQVSEGECKTDIYVKAISDNGENKELRISYKKNNAQFIENKMKPERAEVLLGSNWKNIIIDSISNLTDEFNNRNLIFKSNFGNTQEGSITLGWRFELLDVKSGNLSKKINLSKSQIIDIYSGNNLPEEKKNAKVNGKIITNSGEANYMLRGDGFSDAQEIIDELKTIEDYIHCHPKVYFSCKAVNYRTYDKKFEKARSLAVFVKWSIKNNQLTPELIFNEPLLKDSNEIANDLKDCLNKRNIKTTRDITDSITDSSIIFEK